MEKQKWILLLTHGELGKALVESMSMICGTPEHVYTFPLMPGVSVEAYMETVEKTLSAAPDGSILLADLFGGTPSNISAALAKKYSVMAFTGVNLPMLIGMDSWRNELSEEALVKEAFEAFQNSMQNLGALS